MIIANEIEQLLDIDDDMQREFELELHNFIGDIISNLCNEKNKEINQLDHLVVDNQNNLHNKMKICLNCSEKNIDNKKRNCPNCNEKLPTLDSLNLNQISQKPPE
ncbi:1778_t:CDS:2, partial [Entrophospora sp. SA101]